MDNKFLGFGLGVRTNHFQHIIDNKPDIDWFEALSDNFMVDGGKPRYYLQKIRELYPMALHGVSMSIGSTDELDFNYLKKLKNLIKDVNPVWVSDHLCWTGVDGMNSHDLLPLPYTDDVIKHVANRIKRVQDYLEQPILIENVSSYINYEMSTMTEWEFVNAIIEEANCYLLLDVNNVYVSARNHHFEAIDYLDNINIDRVRQIHLAGHTDNGTHVIDTHDQDVPGTVWNLYQHTVDRFGDISTMIERDGNIPTFESLEEELKIARSIYERSKQKQLHQSC